MATVTIRPNGTLATGANWSNVGGAGSYHAATSDNADGTYADYPSGQSIYVSATLDLAFGTFTLPALAQVRSVTPRVRLSAPAGVPANNARLHFNVGASGGFYGGAWSSDFPAVSGGATITNYTGPALFTNVVLTQADIDALAIQISEVIPGGPGTSVELRVYELYLDVVYNEAPVATVTAPTGSPATSRPVCTWTYSDPDSDAQERYRVKIFDSATYGAGGFDPETASAAWDSGEVFSSTVTATPTVDLTNGITYKAYVKVADVGSNGRYSPWAAGSAFTVTLDPPSVPTLTVAADDTNGRITLAVCTRENLVTANQSSVETDLTGLFAFSGNVTLTRDTTKFLHGIASAKVLRNIAGSGTIGLTLAAYTGSNLTTPANAIPVVAGQAYTAMASFLAAVTPNTAQVYIVWYTAAGVPTGTAVTGALITDATGTWKTAVAAGIAPAAAVYADVWAAYPSAPQNEAHFIDEIYFGPSPSTNLAPERQAGMAFTSGVGTWNGNRCTLTEVAYRSYDGQACLRMEGTSSDPVAQYCNPGGGGIQANGIPVVAGQTYRATARAFALYLAAGHTGLFKINVDWYDAAGTYLSTSPGVQVLATSTGWTESAGDVVAPTNARYANPGIEGTGQNSAGSVLLVDAVGLLQGGGGSWGAGYPAWSIGGYKTLDSEIVQRFVEDATYNGLPTLIRAVNVVVTPTPSLPPLGQDDWLRTIDGDLATADFYANSAPSSVVVDLGEACLISKIRVVHYYGDPRTYHATKTEVSIDGVTWSTIFDSAVSGEYVETSAGRVNTFTPRLVRYIRDSANGSTVNGFNHWVEISAYSPGTFKTVRTFPTVPPVPAGGTFTAYDYEAPAGRTNLYLAYGSALVAGNTVTSAAIDGQYCAANPTDHWLKDPLDPTANLKVKLLGPWMTDEAETEAVFHPLGRPNPVVITDVMHGRDGDLRLLTTSPAEWAALEALLRLTRPLFLQSGPWNEQRYIRLSSNRKVALTGTPAASRREIAVSYVEVDRP